jgi:hypothetical protein
MASQPSAYQPLPGGALPTRLAKRQDVQGGGKTVKEDLQDLTGDGLVDLQDRLLHRGFFDKKRDTNNINILDNAFINRMIVFTWPFFSLFLLLQPWLSNWANNTWYDYTSTYRVYNKNASVEGDYTRTGMCDTEAKYMHCSDGQNFTELALKYRGKAVGCGCGQGVLGEGLCPMTSYGYTLSDFVSTEPSIAAMLGLGFFPLLGTWKNTMLINRLAKPSWFFERVHNWSMLVFQVSYVFWGICSDCIFPTAHAVLTVMFLGAFLAHWVITALICIACMGIANIESVVTTYVASTASGIIVIGAIPRIFLTLNDLIGYPLFWNLNRGIGSYAFWFAEAAGLSLTFGAYPILLLAVWLFPKYKDLNNDGGCDEGEEELFALFPKIEIQG